MLLNRKIKYKSNQPLEIVEANVDHSTGISWAGFWIALAIMNTVTQLIKAGVL